MTRFIKTMVLIAVFALVPAFAHAAPVINRYGQSMCKDIADIRNTNGASFSGQNSVNVPAGGRVSVRALAANTGDQSQTVNFKIQPISPNQPSTSHQFLVTVNGQSDTVTVYTNAPTTVALNSTYKVFRVNPDTMSFNLTGSTENINLSLPPSDPSSAGLTSFGNSYTCTPAPGSGAMPYGWFKYKDHPINNDFEQGIINVYDLKASVPPPCTDCDNDDDEPAGNPNIDLNPNTLYADCSNSCGNATKNITIQWSCGTNAISATGSWIGWSQIPTSGTISYPVDTSDDDTFTATVRCQYSNGQNKQDSDTAQIVNSCVNCGYVPPVVPPPCTVNCNPVPPPCTTCGNGYINPGNTGTQNVMGSPIVKTLYPAKDIEKTSATIRGTFNANGCPAITTWFEWSNDPTDLEFRSTDVVQSNTYGTLKLGISNLRPGTRYYYRIVGQNCKGTAFGATESFVTKPKFLQSEIIQEIDTTKITTVRTNTTTKVQQRTIETLTPGGPGTSYLRLDIDNRNDDTGRQCFAGETVQYYVDWENLTSSPLRDGKLRINLPAQLKFVSTSRGLYDPQSHSIYVAIGDIPAQARDTIVVTTQVDPTGEIGSPVIVEAIAAFDHPTTDAQVNAIDYDEDILGSRELVARSAVTDGGWLNIPWYGWIIFGLILLLVFLIARYYTLVGAHGRGQNNYYSVPPNGYSSHNAYEAPSRPTAPFEGGNDAPPVPRDTTPPGAVYQPYRPTN